MDAIKEKLGGLGDSGILAWLKELIAFIIKVVNDTKDKSWQA